jgi:hypothetical protein
MYQGLTSTTLRVPSNKERLTFDCACPGAQTRGELKVSA